MLDRVSRKCPTLHVVVAPPSEDRGMSHVDWKVKENKPGCFTPEKLEFLKQYRFCVEKVVHFTPYSRNVWSNKI